MDVTLLATNRKWLAALLASVGLAIVSASPAAAQTPTPGVPAGPPVDIHGEWSITRTYWRSCPWCGTPIIRTVPWEITQSGADIRVDRGLRGTVAGAGPAYLSLEGTESDGFGLQRFWYATLHVAGDGNSFEGSFGGSERIQNPCGSDPPTVTCLVSAGWITGIRVNPRPTVPAPPGPPTPVGTPGATATTLIAPPLPSETPTSPGAPSTGTMAATATLGGTSTPADTPTVAPGTASATATAAPLQAPFGSGARQIFLPRAWSGAPSRSR